MPNIPAPPVLDELPAGTKLHAGMGVATVLPDMDFETYSEAGFHWDERIKKYRPPHGAKDKGLPTIGAAAYSEHHSTEVLCLAYDLKDGKGKRLWKPGELPPIDLFKHLASGGLIEAWNCAFEKWVWQNVCVKKYGWPSLELSQLRCAKAKAHAFALPGSLMTVSNLDVLNCQVTKNPDGRRLLNKFSMPHVPTLKDKRRRITPQDDPEDAKNLYNYCLQDIVTEAQISSLIPDLNPIELEFWKIDQLINHRGVQIDVTAVINCISILEQAYEKYTKQLTHITNGEVNSVFEIAKLQRWLEKQDVKLDSLDENSITEYLKKTVAPRIQVVLNIRLKIGLASVKKLYAMLNQVTFDGRLHDLFTYHSARTGRAAGVGAQPQNLPNSGSDVFKCKNCETIHAVTQCPRCFVTDSKSIKWGIESIKRALETISTGDLNQVEFQWGNPVKLISGCLRSMFIASPGYDLICSDYSAIEAVVLAALAREDWRMEVFKTHGKIYEMSASKISGVPFDDFIKHEKQTGEHHPLRSKIGKVAELASGYQGWIGAWKNFGADKFFTDEEMKQAILAWRKASPNIVEFWGGQQRGWFPDYFGLEGAAVQAIMQPGVKFDHNGISYMVKNDILYCQLLSGRHIVYHRPRLGASTRGRDAQSISFEGWNTNPKNGAIGWIRMSTYGGKLTENVVQATARDILTHAIVNLEKRGYKVVLHVHDEIVAEISENQGSIAEFEEIMSTLPFWAQGWPIKASKGWRAKRYVK